VQDCSGIQVAAVRLVLASTTMGMFAVLVMLKPKRLACTPKLALSEFRLQRPRQWGACWLALQLWDLLQRGEFWRPRLPDSREGTSWYHLLQVLTVYRLIDPGSE
jgi:hypothetical protein